MSDPFGDDDIDFDTQALLGAAYNNAVSYLAEQKPPSGSSVCGLSPEIYSPGTGRGRWWWGVTHTRVAPSCSALHRTRAV